ncbi:MAG: rhomboid family intramembrane serine protease [Anaerolineae bacterium]|jgi:membrane associated rhomboid family serine protease|nr:rhomboid family intramembrane serine protease [Anaerolineae bacterium]
MFPLRDNVPSRRFPVVTLVIVVVNVLLFLYEVMMGADAGAFTVSYGVVPARLLAGWYNPGVLFTLLSSMYLHGGWAHLIGNMWYLWIFGDNIEDRMGRLRYFVFYTLCGIGAALIQVAVAPRSTIPMIGASGAIAGVLGAYLLLYPRARVSTLVPVFYFIRIIWLPAVVVLGGWFLVQLLNGLASLNVQMMTGGVAFWAHIGGFVAGMVLMPIFRKRDALPPSLGYDQRYYDPRPRW